MDEEEFRAKAQRGWIQILLSFFKSWINLELFLAEKLRDENFLPLAVAATPRLTRHGLRGIESDVTLLQLIAKKTALGKRYAKKVLENGEVMRNGVMHLDGSTLVGKFDHITACGKILCDLTPRYVILHKPSGILSATSDPLHRTVIDLISEKWACELHLAGRLDRATTGLIILTNDGEFSQSLTHPDEKVPKTYRVTTDRAIRAEAINAFLQGMYFAKENIFTHPAKLDLLHSNSCRLTIFEGKHHQIKRMFLRFGIRVTQLHRESVGKYVLPDDLQVGEYRSFLP